MLGYGGYDRLQGSSGNDTLEGGRGNDQLIGEEGADTYRFSAGFGQDTVYDTYSEGVANHIVFDATISSNDIVIEHDFDGGSTWFDVFVRVAGTEDRITLNGGFGAADYDIRFADGTIWTSADVRQRWSRINRPSLVGDQGGPPMIGGATNDTLDGSDAGDQIEGRGGNDVLSGNAGNDILIGGPGGDSLYGGAGSDVYRFSTGFGEDWIYDAATAGDINILEFDATIDPTKVSVLTDASNRSGAFYLSFAGNEDRIWISRDAREAVISEVRFANGTVWTAADLESRLAYSARPTISSAAAGAHMLGTAGSDTFIGTAGPDEIIGESSIQWRPVGDNLLVNGSFEDKALDAVAEKGGYSASTMPGWMRLDNTLPANLRSFEQKNSGYSDITATAGNYWFDLDGPINSGGGSNLHIAQDVAGLIGGETLLIQFDHANRTYSWSGSFDVLWNGTVVASFNSTGTVMLPAATLVTALAGTNRIGFRGTGYEDDIGASIDNVRLKRAEQAASNVIGSDVLSGLDGDDFIRGGVGGDIISGDAGNDILIGGKGGDSLAGGTGNDVYRFAAGDGQDTITDTSGIDRIEFGAGINLADVVVALIGNSSTLRITFGNSEDSLTITNGSVTDGSAIESFSFADGTVWSFADIASRWKAPTSGNDIIIGTTESEVLHGGAGDDRLFASGGNDTLFGDDGRDILTGSNGADILIGGTGNDTLLGGPGDDVYRWGRGEGNDTLNDTGGIDRIELGAEITPDDVKVIAIDASSLMLRLRDTGEELTLTNVLSSTSYTIESIVFADGTVWTATELRNQSFVGGKDADSLTGTSGADRMDGRGGSDVLAGLAGDDILLGSDGNDTLDGGQGADRIVGGKGDDTLVGGAGADTYVFAAGDGVDTITERGDIANDIFRIEGYALSQIRFGALGRDLVIRFSGSADRIIVRNGLGDGGADLVESFEIAVDNTILSLADIRTRLVDDVAVTGEWLIGGALDGMLTGGTGDDYLKGGDGADVLAGGDGNDHFADLSTDAFVDTMTGGAGRDTYYFLPVRQGASPIVADVITDFQAGGGGDTIRLMTSNPNPFEGGGIWLAQSGNDALVMMRGISGSDQLLVRLLGVQSSALTSANFDGVPIAIDNSVRISDDEAGHVLNGSALDDSIYGNGGIDTIYGFAGNDRLAGGADEDVIDGGFGNDLIAGQEGADRIIGGGNSDIMSGGTGDDVIIGYGDGSLGTDIDVFEGGEGDDRLFGGIGGDIYRFMRSDGRDTITDLGGNDRIEFGTGIAAGDVTVLQLGTDIELSIANEGGRLRLAGALTGTTAIETIAFVDGSRWSWNDVLSRSLQGTAGDDALVVPAASEGMLDGRAGNDVLQGGTGVDTLIGGTGNDILKGGAGDDIYIFARGDGQDVILDSAGSNTLSFASGVLPGEIRAVRNATNLVLEIVGTGDRVDVGSPAISGMGVSRVTFAEGTIWTEATLISLARAASDGDDIIRGDDGDNVLAGGAGDDLLISNGGADTLDGGAGHDRLEGGAGDDIYLFSANGGYDRIFDVAGNDTLLFAADIAPTDITVSQSRDGADFTLIARSTGVRITIENALGAGRLETIRFADRTVWSTADLIARAPSIGDDVLTGDTDKNAMVGGLGNDHLSGVAGNDIYRFARGDGGDVIQDKANSNADRLEINGYTGTEISFHRLAADSDDVAIRFAGTTDQIVIVDALAGDFAGIETIALADGTQFTVSDMRSAILASLTTDGGDIIIGTDGNDRLSGGRGNDLIKGGRGNDAYLYSRGDGDDRINAVSSGADVLTLVDYNVADVVSAVRAGPDSNDLVITFSGVGDRIILIDALSSDNGANNGVSVRFADGTMWDRDAMQSRTLSDTDGVGNDNVYGFDGADTFAMRAGNDLLSGGEGSDLYLFGRGSGNDTVVDSGTSGADKVKILDFTSTQASVERLYRGSDAIVIRFTANAADSLTVFDALTTDAKGIESYIFADGVTWTKESLRQLLDNRVPTAVDDGFFTVTTGVELVIKAADILRNDFDADGDTLIIVGVDAGGTGAATIDARGNVHYTAQNGFYGPASIAYTIADGRNGFATANIDLRVRPVATAYPDSGFTVAEDDSLVIRVERLLANDLDGDRMIVGQVYGARNGTVALSSDGNITFTPTAHFNGEAEFTYAANTPEGGRAEAKVSIQVTPVNDAPAARNDGISSISEGSSFTLDPLALLANDIDIDGDRLVIQSVQSNADITVTIGDDGLIHVAPRAYYWGSAHFDYVVADPSGATATGRVSFDVTPVNNPPEAHDDRFETLESGDPIREDNPVVISVERLLANDIEHDGEKMMVTRVDKSYGGRAELLGNGTVLFTPVADFNGEARFDYQVDDGHGGITWARATVVYQAVNDLPVVLDDGYRDRTLPILRGFEDKAIEIPIIELLKNDYDPEGFTVRFESAGNAVHGDIEITDRGTIIFRPDQDYWGEATFSYLVSDSQGAVDGAMVTLWFENVGDAPPVARRDVIYVNEDIPVVIPIAQLLANDTDVDRDVIRFLGWRPATDLDLLAFGGDDNRKPNGNVEFDADGNLVFTPKRDASKSSGFVYKITDDIDGETEGYVDLVVVPTNDDPTIVQDEGFVTPLDAPLVLRVSDLLKNDYDVEQADHDYDGVIDDDLDNPNRARPTFSGVEDVYDADALALGQRISVGELEVVSWNGEKFIVVRFTPGFTGNVAVEYRIADTEGATDTGFAMASVTNTYTGLLRGTSFADYLAGAPGNDRIQGFGGNDFILGGTGNDTIEAGDGDDHIDTGTGDDWIDGGDGGDHITGGDGFDTVTYLNSEVSVRADLESRIGQGGHAQGDTFIGIEALVGSRFADKLGGDAGDNRLEGRVGNDVLEGRAGNDTLLGDEGDDILIGGAGADILDGGANSDTADYSFGTMGISISLAAGTAHGGDAEGDVLIGIENLTGTDAGDVLEGDKGANVLIGGRGNDILIGGAGDDTLIGGRGADQLVGGSGFDIAGYTMSAEGVVVDMANGAAGGGDALGDTFSGIEIVLGSYHDDIIRGDAGDNRIHGGRGADIIDGRGGFDIADYSHADEGVAVNLSTGFGTAGEAAGDQLFSIEKLLGSLWADQFMGSSGDDWFQGLRGNDAIAGGAGSDTYLFGFDDGRDIITEQGAEIDIDRLVLSSPIAPKDVSVIRDGNDLLLEFERQDGFLVDSVRVTDHFLGRGTGVEEIVFDNGTVWGRNRIEDLQRLGRFNAADDIVRLVLEDESFIIDPAVLFANDADLGIVDLTLIGVDKPVNGMARLRNDGKIEFVGAPNFNGDAFFSYTVRDQFGRESTARVEVNVSPVNDAPTAVGDPIVHAVEDQILRIRIDSLLANDFDVDGDAALEELRIVSIAPLANEAGQAIDYYKENDRQFAASNATADIKGDYIEFKLRPDYFGTAGFIYTLTDASGATSTAKVEIAIAPVNDAPRDRDTYRWIRLGQDMVITVADLMANTYDIEGDVFTFVGLHGGLDGNPGNNGSVVFNEAGGTITFTPWALGPASVEYDVIDARGAAATLTYDFKVRPLNDPPKAHNDYGFRTLEDQVLVIDPASILANDTDENGDKLALESLARFADGGKVRLRADGMIEFRPTADYNGAAGFRYTINDGRGGTSSAYVTITVLPRNEGPILRNDYVIGAEDGPLFVIPAEAFGNDIEADGDVLFFKRADVFGLIDHRFLSADFQVEASGSDGAALPSWLHFDPQMMRFTGTPPVGMKPIAVDVWITDPVNGRVFNTRFALTEKDISEGFDAQAKVLGGYQIRSGFAVNYEFDVKNLDAQTSVTARLADGSALPSWLGFQVDTLTFTGTPPQGSPGPIEVRLSFSRPAVGGGDPLTFTDRVTLDVAAMPAGIVYNSQIALFDMKNGTVSASIAGGRPLPEWLSFDKTTRQVSLSGFEPSADAQLARLQIVFTPAARTLPDGTYATTDRGFTLEFIIDLHADLAGQIAAANLALKGNAYFAAQGLFALDLNDVGQITAARESGAQLPDWLSFDAGSFRFAGSPPPAWVGAVPVRLDIGAGAGKPAMSVITEAVVDDTFRVVPIAASTILSTERSRLLVPADFNGTVVLSYDATDEKGGASRNPAFIFYDVKPMRERPDTASDDIAGREGETVRFAITDLLRNDFDRDRDPLRILELRQPVNGSLVVELARVEIMPPADLERFDGAIWSATRIDGSVLPDWLAIDSATGIVSGYIPLGFAANLGIRFTRTLDGISQSETLNRRVNGNEGAYAVYTPIGSFSGDDAFAYVVTDDREGPSTGTAVVHVAPLYDAPTAVEDTISGVEDTPLLIEPQLLLANDFDVDGNPIRFVGVANAMHGTVSFDGTQILFTPDHNFEGVAAFEYIVTDGTHGSSTGKVKVNVASTNRAPVAATNVFVAIEDTLFEFTTTQLLADDSDSDGDAISFQSLSRTADGGRIIELPGGRWQFVPNENVNGPISFNYTIGDGRRTSTGKITFDVAAVNDAPIANPDGAGTMNDPEGVFRTKQDQTLAVDFSVLVANDRDVEADSFEIVEILDADQGTVSQVGSTAVFTPNAGYIGDAGFHYRVTDSRGASSIGYATLLVMPVVPLPIPVSDFGFEVLEDSFIDIDPAILMVNDYAPEGSTLTFVGLEGATFLENGKYRVMPAADFNGELILRYSVQNEQGFPVSTTVTISVLPVADTPVARADMLEMSEDTTLIIFASQLLANDSDADKQGFVFTRIIGASGVTVSDLGFGQHRITPETNLNGAVWFDYEIEDSTGRTATARVDIAIAPVNDAPVIVVMPVIKGTEDQPFRMTLPNGFVADVDGDALLVELRGKGGVALPSWLTYEHETRTLSGRPPVNFNGAIQLEIAVSDGTVHTVRELLVSIAPVNDAPVVVGQLPDVEIDEDHSFSVALPTHAFSDVDGDSLTYTVSFADGSPLPALVSVVDGNLVGIPPANFNGAVQLAITASDGELSTTESFGFTIRPINDAPVLVHALTDYTGEQARLMSVELDKSAFADVDGDALAFTAQLADGNPLPSWLAFNGSLFTGTPPQTYSGTLDIEVAASDGSLATYGLFRLSIISTNQAPVLARPLPDVSVQEDKEISFAIPSDAFTDGNGDPLTYSAVLADGGTLPAWLIFNGTRFTGTPPANFSGVLDIKMTASDGLLSVSDVFRLTIIPVNDRPVAVNDGPFSVTRGETLGGPTSILLANDIDPDGDTLTILSAGAARMGTVKLGADGLIQYTPDFGYEGTDNFTYVVSDGHLTSFATVRLIVSQAFEGWRQGTANADTLVGGNGVANWIFGGSGNDTISGGDRADRLAGGDGNDRLYGNAGDDEFWGMAGNDTIYGGAGTDTVYFNGVRASYSLVTSGGSIKITDNQTTVNGNDGVDTLSSIERLIFRNAERVTLAAPIILDLDGMGVETKTAGQAVALFDIDSDGLADDTSWIGATEGFLFLDRDGNGTVSGIGEMSFIDDVKGAFSDLEGLRAFDSNRDGVLSADDIRFDDFRIWQDRNGDGEAQETEITTLADNKVLSVDLAATATKEQWEFGSTAIVNRGRYLRADGSSMEYIDAALSYFSATPEKKELQPDNGFVARSGRGEGPALDGLEAALEELRAGIDRNRFIKTDGVPTTCDIGCKDTDSSRVLALMRQDMAAFGKMEGESELLLRKAETMRPIEFYA